MTQPGEKVPNNISDSLTKLYGFRKDNPTNVILGYLNINSLRYKLNGVKTLIGGKVDILAISETKLDSSFPEAEFILTGYSKPYRRDIKDNSGGLMIYVNENIPSRELKLITIKADLQILPIEINIRKQKWIVLSIYKPPKQNLKYFLSEISAIIDFYNTNYDNLLLMGDFNAEPDIPELQDFLNKHNLYNHIKEKTCWKSKNGSCIDLLISNKRYSFKHSGVAETGLSDFHSLIYIMLKTTYVKPRPKKYKYRNYKNFNQIYFLSEISTALEHVTNFTEFNDRYIMILNKHAPLKTRFLRANNKPHITKQLRKAMMIRSHLKNIANKSNDPKDMVSYRAQRNLVVNMNRKAKRLYFHSESKTCDKTFWSACKPFFSDKALSGSRTILVEKDEIISDDKKVATVFNDYFANITESLEISPWNPSFLLPRDAPIESIYEKFRTHPSILSIKERFSEVVPFEFSHVTPTDIYEVIMSLDSSKKTSGDIPTKILVQSVACISNSLSNCFTNCLDMGVFPHELKLADVIPVHKKDSATNKENYRPISLLPSLSKVFERVLCTQLSSFMADKLSKYLCGFRKGYSTQYALLNLIHAWQKCLSNSGRVGTVLTDLSKAFDCLPHDLLVAKLRAYGLGSFSIKFLRSYLTNRKMRVRIASSFSDWLEVFLGVPQGSILGPILFNIFINDLFFCKVNSDICNFADDNTLYSCGFSFEAVIEKLQTDTRIIVDWFVANQMAVNEDKFQVMFLGPGGEGLSINIGNFTIQSNNTVKLLGVTLDRKLSFSDHISDMCNKANSKIRALLRIRKFLSTRKAFHLCNAFIMSRFKYCPLIWMFSSKASGRKIDSTQVRALRAVLFNFEIPRSELYSSLNVTPVHTTCLQSLLVEVFKSIHKLNPEFMWDMFTVKHPNMELRKKVLLALPAKLGKNSIVFRGVLAWNNLPSCLMSIESLNAFRSAIRKVSGIYCTCKSCA